MVFLPAVLPPPIPLWPFLLAAGALGATARRFLAAFGSGRALRYSIVGWLAMGYGRRIVRAWSATLEQWSALILWTFILLTAVGLGFSIWKLRRHAARNLVSGGARNDPEQPQPGQNYSQLT
jgi:hypothetical protein